MHGDARGEGPRIDLNADLGEGYGRWSLGDDEALLAVVTSANVACGGHAGDPTTMRRTCEAAAARGVTVGAHVAYRDLAGFGRRFVDVDPEELADDVLHQIGGLQAVARAAGTQVAYVKPHGALYNAVVHHEAQAEAVVRAVRELDPSLAQLGLPGSAYLRLAAEAGLPVTAEAFADRAYTPAGTLVARREPGAVVHDPDVVVARSVRLATRGEVEAADGSVLRMDVASLCVHGDTPGAAALARDVREALVGAGVRLAPFAAGRVASAARPVPSGSLPG